MLSDNAFILHRHFVARERHHPRAVRAVPSVERQLIEHLGLDPLAAQRVSAVRRAASLGIVGRAAVDFLAHSRAPARVTTANARQAPFGHRPRLSLRLRALPLRRPAIALATVGTFQTVRRARSFCLRDSGGGCSFGAAPRMSPSANSPARPSDGEPPVTRPALAAAHARVNASRYT